MKSQRFAGRLGTLLAHVGGFWSRGRGTNPAFPGEIPRANGAIARGSAPTRRESRNGGYLPRQGRLYEGDFSRLVGSIRDQSPPAGLDAGPGGPRDRALRDQSPPSRAGPARPISPGQGAARPMFPRLSCGCPRSSHSIRDQSPLKPRLSSGGRGMSSPDADPAGTHTATNLPLFGALRPSIRCPVRPIHRRADVMREQCPSGTRVMSLDARRMSPAAAPVRSPRRRSVFDSRTV